MSRTAAVLNITQPAVSKALARLRHCFGDPLFVRVGSRMEPTPKAKAMAAPTREILARLQALQSENVLFDPPTTPREFTFFMIDGAVVTFFPKLLKVTQARAPNVRLHALHADATRIDQLLESGAADFAVGGFFGLVESVRRQYLWTERYMALIRKDHPRLGENPPEELFYSEKHVLISAKGMSHGHVFAEKNIESLIPAENIVCCVPMFAAAAHIVKNSDAIAIFPSSLAATVAQNLDLHLFAPPFNFPTFDVAVYWHERFHRDAGNIWMRNIFKDVLHPAPSETVKENHL